MLPGILTGIIVIAVIVLIGCFFMTNLIMKPRVRTSKAVLEEELNNGRLDQKFFESAKKEETWIDSTYGYRLSCLVLENEVTQRPENKTKVAVFCHGYTYGKMGAVVYAQILMELGFTAVLYDHRNHGDSDKKFTSMGYYEKDDLETVITWCYQKFGEDIRIVTYGESMGAATVLCHLLINHKIAAVIADCPYSDLSELEKYQINSYFHIPTGILMPVANLFLRLRAGFWSKEVSPIKAALYSETPILFIHGDEDHYVPTKMSVEMYEKRKGPKELYLCKGAKHAQSCEVDYDTYRSTVQNFLRKYYPIE